MFLDLARREEIHHTRGRGSSLTYDLLNVEQTGVHTLLCFMEKMMIDRPLDMLPRTLECGQYLSRSKADNRKYIILHKLEKLLESMIGRLPE